MKDQKMLKVNYQLKRLIYSIYLWYKNCINNILYSMLINVLRFKNGRYNRSRIK